MKAPFVATTKKQLETLVRNVLKHPEIKVKDIAQQTGLSRQFLEFIRDGKRQASLENLMLLANFWNINYRFESDSLRKKK